MRSPKKRWFTEEAGRAGWISVATCVIAECLCGWLASGGREPWGAIFAYVLFPMGLGWVAVGALNFRRWHSFRESMQACLAAVVNTFKLLGTLGLLALFFSLSRVLVFLYFLIALLYWSVILAFWVAVIFLVAVLEAWAAGATLYGLLRLMRYVGEAGQAAKVQKKDDGPRALQMVV